MCSEAVWSGAGAGERPCGEGLRERRIISLKLLTPLAALLAALLAAFEIDRPLSAGGDTWPSCWSLQVTSCKLQVASCNETSCKARVALHAASPGAGYNQPHDERG